MPACAIKTGDGEVAGVSLARPDSLLVPLEPLLENLAACHMVIGMRLHALILAAACAVPAVALSYDPKVTAFMAQSGQSDAVYDLAADTPDLADTDAPRLGQRAAARRRAAGPPAVPARRRPAQRRCRAGDC